MRHLLSAALCSLLYIFLMGACTNLNKQKIGKESDGISNILEVRIQPDKIVSRHTKDFVQAVEFIPLETTDDSEFGEISQIQTTPNFYVILDRLTNEILFFRKNGDFVRKISSQNHDIPIPFKSIFKFTIDMEHEILSFPDVQSHLIYEFDLLGNFIKTREKDPIDYTIRESHYLDTNKIDYFSYENTKSDKAKNASIVINKDGGDTIPYLFFDPAIIAQTDVYGAQKYFFKSTESLLFSRPYDYTIYDFGTDGNMKAYLRISLPEELSLPTDFLTSSKYTNKRRAYTNSHKSTVYLITDVYKTGNILYCRLMGSKYVKALLYDLNNDVLVDFRSYISDASTLFLPFAGRDVLGVDNNRLVSAIPAQRMIQAVTTNINIMDYLSSLPDHLREYYKKGNNQNPILVLTELKKSFSYAKD